MYLVKIPEDMFLCDVALVRPLFLQELSSDVEVKYKIYQCLTHLKQYREAMSVVRQKLP